VKLAFFPLFWGQRKGEILCAYSYSLFPFKRICSVFSFSGFLHEGACFVGCVHSSLRGLPLSIGAFLDAAATFFSRRTKLTVFSCVACEGGTPCFLIVF